MVCIKRFLLAVFVVAVSIIGVSAQDFLYRQGPVNQPASIVKRLSYENFRNIKILQSAIINYGGGEQEIDRLVDQYAEASALYFQNQTEKAAEKFLENEREILNSAKKLAKIYREDADKMLVEANRKNIKAKMSLTGKHQASADYFDKYLQASRFAFIKANDHYDRYINAKQAPPRELITSIYYYRRAKEGIINMEMTIEIDKVEFEKTALKTRKEEIEYKEKKKRETKKQFAEKYKREIDDNNNKVYSSKEKKN